MNNKLVILDIVCKNAQLTVAYCKSFVGVKQYEDSTRIVQ